MRQLNIEKSENFHDYKDSPMMEKISKLDAHKEAIIVKLKIAVESVPPNIDNIKSIVVEAAQIYDNKVLDDSIVAEVAETIARKAYYANERHLYLILRQRLNALE